MPLGILLFFLWCLTSSACLETDVIIIRSEKNPNTYSMKEYVDYYRANGATYNREGFSILPEYDEMYWFYSCLFLVEPLLDEYWRGRPRAGFQYSWIYKKYMKNQEWPTAGMLQRDASGNLVKLEKFSPFLMHEREHWINLHNEAQFFLHDRGSEVFVTDSKSVFSATCRYQLSIMGFNHANISVSTTKCVTSANYDLNGERVIVLPLGKWGQVNFYHIWVDTLMHWFTLPDNVKNDESIKVLIDRRTSFSKYALEVFGISEQRIIEFDRGKDCSLSFKEIILPTLPICMKPILPQMMLMRHHFGVRELNFTHYKLPFRSPAISFSSFFSSSNSSVMIVLDRRQSRPVNNTNEMLSALQLKYKDKWIVKKYDHEPIEETIRFFKNARIIIGHHGAGLTNMLFSSSAGIIEIHDTSFRPDGLIDCYSVMAKKLQFPYMAISGHRSFYDIPKVMEYIERMIAIVTK